MRMTFAQLEAFYWIVRLGSFREAARQIGRAQPSVSLRIRELETVLGEKVLDRHGNEVKITAAGTSLLRYAERFLMLAEELEGNMRSQRLTLERIRIGAIDSFAMSCIPQIVQGAEELFPDTHIEVTVDYNANLVRKLNSRALDIAFLIDPDDQSFLTKEYLCAINQAWVGSTKERWSEKIYYPHDLADKVVFTLPEPAVPIVHNWFAAGGVKPTRVSLCNTMGMTAQLIAAGLGIGVLPRGIALAGLQSGSLIEIRTSPTVQPASLYMVYLDRFRFRFRNLLEKSRAIVTQQNPYL